MKKYIGIFLLIGVFGIVLGQENISGLESENYVEPGKTKIINQDIAPTGEAGNLENIKLRFCNEMESNKFTIDLETETRPGKSREICIILSNVGVKEANVLVGFAEGIIDAKGKMSCANDISNTNSFSKYIVNAPTTGIVIPASGNVIQKIRYVAPKNASGDIFGCAVYKINQEEIIQPGKMFLVVIRKVAPIYINITGSVYNFGRWDDIQNVYTTNRQSVLKIIIAILAVRLIVSIVKTTKKKEKSNKKK